MEVRRVATIDAIWTKGPSFPRGIPLPRVAVKPTIFATRVFAVRYSLRTTPLKMVFISGIPEPMACGATTWTNPALNNTKQIGSDTQARNLKKT